MQKSEDAVTFMQQQLDDVEFIYPEKVDFESFVSQSPFEPFSEAVIDFLNDLSQLLYRKADIRSFPDVATFAFFCRKANILAQKKKYAFDDALRLGRGIVFHITPSNVPVNFAYSLVSGWLSGNINIVRVPSKNFEQVNIICSAIYELSLKNEHKDITNRLLLIRYDRKSTATALFSSLCDIRIIWGGDDTITDIRRNPIPPRSFDVTFADRYSMCAINADKLVNDTSPDKLVTGFYNDTFLFDQNACSSPHLIIWLGSLSNVEKAQEIFWTKLYNLVKEKYSVIPVIAIDKLTSFYSQSATLEYVRKVDMPDNLIWRMRIQELPDNIDNYRCSSGYFYEYHAGSLFELSKIINRKYQTLAYYGIENSDFVNFMKQARPLGLDRIVPVGKTTDFSLTWDGYDLILTLSRICTILS
jgi:hypothetical protein